MAEEGWKSQDKMYEGSKAGEMEISGREREKERESIAVAHSLISAANW